MLFYAGVLIFLLWLGTNYSESFPEFAAFANGDGDSLWFFLLFLGVYWWFAFRHRATISTRTHVISCDTLIQRLRAADGAALMITRIDKHANDACHETWWIKDVEELAQLPSRDSRDVRQFVDRLSSTAAGTSMLVGDSQPTIRQRLLDEEFEDSNSVFTAFLSSESASIGYGVDEFEPARM